MNDDCDDLETRKVYQVLPDSEAEEEGYIRVIDESGEDSLYPASYFVLVDLPREAASALLLAWQRYSPTEEIRTSFQMDSGGLQG